MHLHLSLLLLGATIMLTLSVLPHQPPPPCSEIPECALALTAISPCFPYIKTRNSGPASAPSAVCCKIFIKAVRAGRARCVCYLLWDPLLLDFLVDTNRLISLFSSCGASASVSASSWIHDTCGEMGTLPPLNTIAPASTRAFNSSIDTNTVLPFPNEAPSCCSYFSSSSAHGSSGQAKVAYGFPSDQISIFFWGIILLVVSLLPLWWLLFKAKANLCSSLKNLLFSI
ncbi:bifunctional inhibitor/lipid-transfer protein/seed storage 2S albumin superfamily protein isoform X2 [Carex rostrata]